MTLRIRSAYRENKGVTEAIKQATEYMENGYTWSVELDIHIHLDNINQDFLINKIQNHISDDKIPNLIITYLKCTVIDGHIIYDVNAKEPIK